MNSEALRQIEHPTDPTIDNCSDKLLRANSQPRSSNQAGAPGSSEADHVMTKQASVLELKPDSPSQMRSKHLEKFHKTKVMLNFGFRNADNSQATQPTTSTNPFAALEVDNPEAEDAMDNPEEMREGWTFQGRKKHTPKIASLRQVLSQFTTLTPNHDVTPGGKKEVYTLRRALLLLHLIGNLVSTRAGTHQSKNLAGLVKGKKRPEGDSDLR